MKCSVPDCSTPAKYKGLCGKHYKRQWRHGDPQTTLIQMNEGAKCSYILCDRPADSLGLCKMHYTQQWRTGNPEVIRAPAGTGRPRTASGHILITVKGERKYEHIYKAEQALGKPLPAKAVVHHMNNIPWDNDTPFNLVICPDQAYHMLLHKRMRDLR